jgi:hypothetical protein
MKMEDILMEIYRGKEAEISEEEARESEKIDKAIRNSPAFKQAVTQLDKLVLSVRQHGFKIKETYGSVDLDKVHIEVGSLESDKKFAQKRDKLNKAFLELRVAIVTTGKVGQEKLIKGFTEAAF